MWNSNSRRWLVKENENENDNKDEKCSNDDDPHHTIATLRVREHRHTLQHSKRKCGGCDAVSVAATTTAISKLQSQNALLSTRTTTTTSSTTTATTATAATATGTLSTRRNSRRPPPPPALTLPTPPQSMSARVKPCPNQILEVLLAILLANCLAHIVTLVPTATAAFGAANTANTATALDLADEAPSIYSSSSSFSSGSGSSRRSNHRQPHSIGVGVGVGVGGSGSAFSYNSLPLPANTIDDYVLPQLPPQALRSQNFKISPKACSIGRIEGTCMFVWECIKSEGRHVGMCVDSFMFGSCCAHNYTDNIVLPPAFAYTRPTKPVGMSSLNHRPRPPHLPHRPSISGMTTIERPHGAGTLVIRPSGPHHQGALHKPQYTKPPTTTTLSTSSSTTLSTSTTENPSLLWTSNAVLDDLQPAASISTSSSSSSSSSNNMWHSSAVHHTTTTSTTVSAGSFNQQQQQQQQQQHQYTQQHWHMPTEPNFITKPRPPSWEKPMPLRPKPPPTKPTKKPIVNAERPALLPQQQPPQQQPLQHHHHQQQTPSSIVYSTRKPATTLTPPTSATTTTRTRPQPPYTTTMTRPTQAPSSLTPAYSRPTPGWVSTSSSSGSGGSVSASAPSSSGSNTQPIHFTSTTTQKYRPTPPPSSSSAATGAPTKTTQRPYVPPTPHPTAATSLSTAAATHSTASSTSTAFASSSSSSQTLPPHNLTTIESNEIADISDGSPTIATVKTISAARSECGIPVLARPETRIVGGKSAAFGRWPWQVSVRRTSFFGFSSTHRCGGALINENWIATAGHCVDDLLISQIRIRVGEYDFSHVLEQLPYIERGVAKKVVHPNYNFFTYEYDLALVKLEQPLEFAPHVSPICLPQTESLLIGMNATVTGWGRLSEGGTLPSVLQEVSVPIVSNDNCKTMFLRAGRKEFIPEIFLCAGYETGGQDSCQGDSGGPLQVKSQDGRFFLAGIISWGIGCAEANLPGVCTRISKFVPWIMENVT